MSCGSRNFGNTDSDNFRAVEREIEREEDEGKEHRVEEVNFEKKSAIKSIKDSDNFGEGQAVKRNECINKT